MPDKIKDKLLEIKVREINHLLNLLIKNNKEIENTFNNRKFEHLHLLANQNKHCAIELKDLLCLNDLPKKSD